MLRINCNNGGKGFKMAGCFCNSKVLLRCSRTKRKPQKIYHYFCIIIKNSRNTVELCWCCITTEILSNLTVMLATPEIKSNQDVVKSATPEILSNSEAVMSATPEILWNFYTALLNCWKRLNLIHVEKHINCW